MSEYGSDYDESMGALNKYIQQQQALASQQPSGVFSKVSPIDLAFAQGLLAPTRTGSFGESLGLGLQAAQSPLESMKKQQLDAQSKVAELQMARARLAMMAPYYQARANHLGGLSNGSGLATDSVTLNRTWNILNNSDPSDLNMTEDEVANAKQAVARRLIDLSLKGNQKTLAGVAAGGSNQPQSPADITNQDQGPIPQITNDQNGFAAYNSLAPGAVYKDPEGQIRQKPATAGE